MQAPTTQMKIQLDLLQALENLGGDTVLLHDLGEILLDDLPILLDQLKTATDLNQVEAIKQTVHSIRGLCVNFGAEPTITLAHQIETDLDCQLPFEIVKTKLMQLIEVLQETINEIRCQVVAG